MANFGEENGYGVMIEHDDDDALRLEQPEQLAPVQGFCPSGIGLEEHVALGEGIEVEISTLAAPDVCKGVC